MEQREQIREKTHLGKRILGEDGGEESKMQLEKPQLFFLGSFSNKEWCC